MTAELRHNSFHCLLVLLQQVTELSVLMEQRMVLDNNLRVHPLQLGLEDLC